MWETAVGIGTSGLSVIMLLALPQGTERLGLYLEEVCPIGQQTCLASAA